jgi:hypothetical protein
VEAQPDSEAAIDTVQQCSNATIAVEQPLDATVDSQSADDTMDEAAVRHLSTAEAGEVYCTAPATQLAQRVAAVCRDMAPDMEAHDTEHSEGSDSPGASSAPVASPIMQMLFQRDNTSVDGVPAPNLHEQAVN